MHVNHIHNQCILYNWWEGFYSIFNFIVVRTVTVFLLGFYKHRQRLYFAQSNTLPQCHLCMCPLANQDLYTDHRWVTNQNSSLVLIFVFNTNNNQDYLNKNWIFPYDISLWKSITASCMAKLSQSVVHNCTTIPSQAGQLTLTSLMAWLARPFSPGHTAVHPCVLEGATKDTGSGFWISWFSQAADTHWAIMPHRTPPGPWLSC